MEYSIHEVAKAAGTTSRTLRHYDSIGLVVPSRIGANGYRRYDDRALVRLQRVLLLRGLGLGLSAIRDVLEAQAAGGDDPAAEARALTAHLELLHHERERVDRQIAAVERTIGALTHAYDTNERTGLMAARMFDGFDHTEYREEVEERWGVDAYAASDAWWRGLGAEGQRDWRARLAELNAEWIVAAEHGVDPASDAALELAARHCAWLRSVPGTPSGADFAGYVRGLGDMYVADERFAANYGGMAGAEFVRDALRAHLDAEAGSAAS